MTAPPCIDWQTMGTWVEALALVFICGVDAVSLRFLYEERKEQREARKEEREERMQAELARERSDITCVGVTSILRSMSEEQLCTTLWAQNSRHAGFAFDTPMYARVPEFLRTKGEMFIKDITRGIPQEQLKTARFLLVYLFPYSRFDLVFEDICKLNFGNTILVWDENGKPMKIPRD